MIQVGRTITDAGGAPLGVDFSGDIGAGPGDWQLGAGRGPGPDRFQCGTLPTDCTCKTVVLLPNGKGNYRGIGLIKVLCKTVSGLINF